LNQIKFALGKSGAERNLSTVQNRKKETKTLKKADWGSLIQGTISLRVEGESAKKRRIAKKTATGVQKKRPARDEKKKDKRCWAKGAWRRRKSNP